VIASTSDAVTLVLIVAVSLLVLVLILVVRSVLRTVPPITRRFRIGVFVERDAEGPKDDERSPRD
jgi:hypothetical protein